MGAIGEMHVTVDARHGDDLLNKVVMPMLLRCPDALEEVATGMLIRYHIATDYYDGLASLMGIG